MNREDQMILCPNCGAEINESEDRCPYCGYINPVGAEKKFMNDLDDTRKRLDVVDDIAEDEFMDEVKSRSKKMVKTAVIIAIAIIAIIAIVGITKAVKAKSDHEKYGIDNFTKQREVFSELDKYFDSGDYEGMVDATIEAMDEVEDIWEWKHYEFFSVYLDYLCIKESLAALDEGEKLSSYENESLTYYCFKLYYRDFDNVYSLSDKELEVIEGLRDEAVDVVHDRLGFTDSDMDKFKDDLYKDDFLSMSECGKIAEKYCEGYK